MALIPAGYMKAIVSLGISEDSFRHIGTGFLYSHPVGTTGDVTNYRAYLATNRHVAESNPDSVRFNHPAYNVPEVHSLTSVVNGEWLTHPGGADVAAIRLRNPGPLTVSRNLVNAEAFVGGICTPSDKDLTAITEGLGVFLIGYPLGLVGDTHNFPIVRSGVIARIQDWLSGAKDTFLIDAPAFPGNSGGPVIVCPNATAISGSTAITHALLIGLVSQNIRSREVAVNPESGEVRIVFEENSGLSIVVPISALNMILTSDA